MRSRKPIVLAGVFLIPMALLVGAQPPTASATGQLFAWANPLVGPLADHTWVTDYGKKPICPHPDSAYWYSTGGCHPSGKDGPPRPLANAPGDLKVARCIAKPDESTFQPGPATALILYGVDGVCHQICNRVLSATSTATNKQVTVAKAHGYRISRFVYGTHGTPAQWKSLQAQCRPVRALVMTPDEELDSMIADAFGKGLTAPKAAILRSAHVGLQIQVREISGQVQAGSISGLEFANRVNETVNRSLNGVAETLGKDDFQRFFEWSAGEKITLVNPQIAEKVRYK